MITWENFTFKPQQIHAVKSWSEKGRLALLRADTMWEFPSPVACWILSLHVLFIRLLIVLIFNSEWLEGVLQYRCKPLYRFWALCPSLLPAPSLPNAEHTCLPTSQPEKYSQVHQGQACPQASQHSSPGPFPPPYFQTPLSLPLSKGVILLGVYSVLWSWRCSGTGWMFIKLFTEVNPLSSSLTHCSTWIFCIDWFRAS